jgi:hypothetical protein
LNIQQGKSFRAFNSRLSLRAVEPAIACIEANLDTILLN